jgi:hypothetical protein
LQELARLDALRHRERLERDRAAERARRERLVLASRLPTKESNEMQRRILIENYQKKLRELPDRVHSLRESEEFRTSLEGTRGAIAAAQFNEAIVDAFEKDPNRMSPEEILEALQHDTFEGGERPPPEAKFLRYVGKLEEEKTRYTLNMTEVERARVSIKELRKVCTTEQQQALDLLSQTLEQYVAKVDPVTDQFYHLRVQQIHQPDEYTRQLKLLGRGALAALAGIGAILTGVVALFSKEKDFTVPAIYAGVATAAAVGPQLFTGPTQHTLEQIDFLTQPAYTRLAEAYGISGERWAQIAEEIHGNRSKELQAFLEKTRKGQKITDEERRALVEELAGSLDSKEAHTLLKMMQTFTTLPDGTRVNDFSSFVGFLNPKKLDQKTFDEVVLPWIRKGVSRQALADLGRTTTPSS